MIRECCLKDSGRAGAKAAEVDQADGATTERRKEREGEKRREHVGAYPHSKLRWLQLSGREGGCPRTCSLAFNVGIDGYIAETVRPSGEKLERKGDGEKRGKKGKGERTPRRSRREAAIALDFSVD